MRELTRLYPLPKVPEGWAWRVTQEGDEITVRLDDPSGACAGCRVVDVTKSGAAVAVIDAAKGAAERLSL